MRRAREDTGRECVYSRHRRRKESNRTVGGAANKEAELATLGNMHVEEDQVVEEDQACGGGSSLWRNRMGERGCIGIG